MQTHQPRFGAMRKVKSNGPVSPPPPEQAAGGAMPFLGKPGILLLLLGVSTLVVYWPVTACGFLNFDDEVYVTANGWVLRPLSWAGVHWAFTTLEAGFWHPLTWLSFMFDYQLYGLRPGGYHFTNLLLHAASMVTLFWLVERMTGRALRAAVVAALFALHPLHVESVAWIAERKDVLSTFFGFLSLLFYARYTRPKTADRLSVTVDYFLALFFFSCGLMSKTMVVTWPVIMLLLDYWPLQRVSGCATHHSTTKVRNLRQLVIEKIPFFLLSIITGLLTLRAEKMFGAIAESPIPLLTRLTNTAVSLACYLYQTVWPVNLSVFYPYPKSISAPAVGVAVVVLALITLASLKLARRRPYLAFGWLWFLITILPVSGLIQVGSHARADRYTYVPLTGIFLMVTWGSAELFARRQFSTRLAEGLAIMILGACAFRTADQLRYWSDSGVLFTHARAVNHDNGLADVNLGYHYMQQKRFAEAADCFRRALELNPGSAEALINLGACKAEKNDFTGAVADYEAAMRLNVNRPEAYVDLGNILVKAGKIADGVVQLRGAIRRFPNFPPAHDSLGRALAMQGKYDEAIHEYNETLRLSPDLADTHNSLGLALVARGELEPAVQAYQTALRLDPNLVEVHNNLGSALVSLDRVDEAIGHFKALLQLNPHYPNAHANLGIALAMKGASGEAVTQFRAALHDEPNDADTFFNFGNVLVQQHRFDYAVRAYEDAIRLKPGHSQAQCNLGSALAELGRKDEAIIHLREALRLHPDLAAAKAKLRELGETAEK
jgi:protein O-mannosyl-transferase